MVSRGRSFGKEKFEFWKEKFEGRQILIGEKFDFCLDDLTPIAYDQCMTNPRTRIIDILNDASLDDDDCNFYLATRELLMNTDLFAIDSSNLNRSQRRALLELRDLLIDADTELITQLRLDHSLCPLHAIDYAICFDDNDDECAAIRQIHPDHDT